MDNLKDFLNKYLTVQNHLGPISCVASASHAGNVIRIDLKNEHLVKIDGNSIVRLLMDSFKEDPARY